MHLEGLLLKEPGQTLVAVWYLPSPHHNFNGYSRRSRKIEEQIVVLVVQEQLRYRKPSYVRLCQQLLLALLVLEPVQ